VLVRMCVESAWQHSPRGLHYRWRPLHHLVCFFLFFCVSMLGPTIRVMAPYQPLCRLEVSCS
jgi:hypothetical protein